MKKMHVIKGDTVMVISGAGALSRDAKSGDKKAAVAKILSVNAEKGTVIVEGVNLRYRHQKPRGQQMPGGRIEREMPIAVSNVMLYCPKCKKPTRIAYKLKGDEKVRVCKHCDNELKKKEPPRS